MAGGRGVKVYEVLEGTWVRVVIDAQEMFEHCPVPEGTELKVQHRDGLYQDCVDRDGQTVKLVAWQQVELV